MNQTLERQDVRRLSRALFGGAQYRLEVGAAIAAAAPVVSGPDIRDALGIVAQSVNQEMLVLERAGLLVRVSSLAAERVVYYSVAESTYWAFCAEAATGAREMLGRSFGF